MISLSSYKPSKTIHKVKDELRHGWPVRLLLITRAVVVGLAFMLVAHIPGVTSSFVAIFVALIAFDLMVAAPSLRPQKQGFKEMMKAVRRTLSETVSSLLKGVILGCIFGIFALVGFPYLLGAILTVGLGYMWSVIKRSLFTSYVAILAGLSLYEQISGVEETGSFIEIWHVASSNVTGTLTALIFGWIVGILMGTVVRIILKRPYRWHMSMAYDPPIIRQPFDDVVHLGRKYQVITIDVAGESDMSGKTLSELRLRQDYEATVIRITREGTDIPMPSGKEVIKANDHLLMLCHPDKIECLLAMAKTKGTTSL